MNSLQETTRIFTEINTFILGQMEKRPEVKGEYYFTRNGEISDFLYKEYWEKLIEVTQNLRGEILRFENPRKIPLVNILKDLLEDNVLLLEGNSNEHAQHILGIADEYSEWLKVIIPKPKERKLPTFEGLFRNDANAQKVKNALKKYHYTENGKWAANKETKLNQKGNKKEFVASYWVLYEKGIFNTDKKTTIGKVFMKEFSYPDKISDTSLYERPDDLYLNKFIRIYTEEKITYK